MKVKELRIGNFVKLGKRKNTLEVYGVKQFDVGIEGISNELNVYLMDKKYIYNVVSDEDIKPIPLTEEWLEKFGFEYDEDFGWLFVHKKIYFILHYNPKSKNVVVEVDEESVITVPQNIKYVHQLQNLYFALTGEELILNA